MAVDKDKRLKDMTELLLSKATMLPYHCGDCKSPLFEKNEKIICPVCGKLKLEKKEEKTKTNGPSADPKISEILNKKRDEILAQIENEKNPKKLISLLEVLEKINKL